MTLRDKWLRGVERGADPSQNGPMRSLLLSLLSVAACATPRANLPPLPPPEVADRRLAVQREAVADALIREERVLRLAWPILTANADLCPKTKPRLGFRYGDAKAVKGAARGLTIDQVRALGWDDTPKLLSVAPGSPASQAGLQPGDRIRAVGDEAVTEAADIARLIGDAWDREEEPGPIKMSVERDGSAVEATLEPMEACDVAVVSSSSNAINATASFRKLTIYAGLLRALPDDNAVSFVLAHELAHWAGAHPRKVVTNAVTTGAGLWGPPLLLVSRVADVVAYPLSKPLGAESPPFRTLTMKAVGGAVRSPAFEREADYAGLYMLIRAGGSAGDVDQIFQLFSNVSPRSTWMQVTHPTTPERQLRLQATAEEIAKKQSAKEPLIPDGWVVD